ncbi:flagellar motor protein MotB, partial [Pseudoxanthomonas sp. SGD-10]
MKKLLRFSVCLILAICVFKPVNLKSNDLAKANKYYDRYDYHYAIEIYERLMRKKPSLEVAQRLANAYKFVNNVDAAETAYAKVLTFSDA